MQTKIQPVFILKHYAIVLTTYSVPVFIWMIFAIQHSSEEDVVRMSFVLFFYYMLIPLGISIIRYFWLKSQSFIIEEDKISYINSFINYRRKDIKFEDIKEVILKIGCIQKMFGLGNIEFITNASSPYAHGINKSGLTFFNFENPQEVYDLVQQRIAEHKKK